MFGTISSFESDLGKTRISNTDITKEGREGIGYRGTNPRNGLLISIEMEEAADTKVGGTSLSTKKI
jgi:hypothetical protein